jgi:hypothetical protein
MVAVAAHRLAGSQATRPAVQAVRRTTTAPSVQSRRVTGSQIYGQSATRPGGQPCRAAPTPAAAGTTAPRHHRTRKHRSTGRQTQQAAPHSSAAPNTAPHGPHQAPPLTAPRRRRISSTSEDGGWGWGCGEPAAGTIHQDGGWRTGRDATRVFVGLGTGSWIGRPESS